MASDFQVTAMVATYNEEDIIAQSVTSLLENGIRVVVLDDGSTDRTCEILQGLQAGNSLVVERISEPGQSPEFALEKIMARKQALARELSSDWFINADADEF